MKGAEGMDTSRTARENEARAPEPRRFTKRLGSMVYEVAVHFNQDAKETMDDKRLALIRRDMEAAS
jgi:hypothetical protein